MWLKMRLQRKQRFFCLLTVYISVEYVICTVQVVCRPNKSNILRISWQMTWLLRTFSLKISWNDKKLKQSNQFQRRQKKLLKVEKIYKKIKKKFIHVINSKINVIIFFNGKIENVWPPLGGDYVICEWGLISIWS